MDRINIALKVRRANETQTSQTNMALTPAMHALFRACFGTVGLTSLCLALFFWVEAQATLYLDREAIIQGQWWRLLSGHLAHASSPHLALNLFAFCLLAGYTEYRSRKLFCLTLLAGLISVNALLMSPWSELERYSGLSGILNALFVTALYLTARQLGKTWLVLVTLAYIAKLSFELRSASVGVVIPGWPPYPPAHIAGALGGLLSLIVYTSINRGSANQQQEHVQ